MDVAAVMGIPDWDSFQEQWKHLQVSSSIKQWRCVCAGSSRTVCCARIYVYQSTLNNTHLSVSLWLHNIFDTKSFAEFIEGVQSLPMVHVRFLFCNPHYRTTRPKNHDYRETTGPSAKKSTFGGRPVHLYVLQYMKTRLLRFNTKSRITSNIVGLLNWENHILYIWEQIQV